MNMENETKQTKAYIYFVYFLYMQLAHFPHIFFQAKFCLQFCLVKCAENARKTQEKRPFVHQPNFEEIGLVSVATPPP